MKDFIQKFVDVVKNYPLNKAVSHNGKKLNYKELDLISNKVANYLSSQGVKKGDIIGVTVDRSIELLIAMLAIFKLGSTYLPIDSDLPLERKKYIIKKSECKLIINGVLDDTEILEVNSLNIFDAINYNDISNIISTPCGVDDIAYIIFTSGTTGQPKGVMVKQIGMANHIQAKVDVLSINENSIIAQTAPQSFDISIWQFLSALTVGGETVIIDKEILQYPQILVEKLNVEQATIIQFVPSLFNTFINSIKDLNVKFKSLKIVATVGEPLLPTTCMNWFNLYKHIPILNHYGPTECSDGVTHYLISNMNDIPDTVTPIGKPISGLNLYICEVDVANGELIEITEPYKTGELYVSGLGVSAGYINDQEKTNSVFFNNPFSSDINHSRIYKTGDLVRYNKIQQLECLGRVDRQVKVRGHRIELAEIENKLIQISRVKECAVIIKKENKIKITARDMNEIEDVDMTNLVAYVVCEQSVTRKLLIDELSTYLPDYMLPDYFIVCDHIPHNSNGKIDYNNLKNLEKTRPLTDHPFLLPINEIQTKLCELYSGLVNVSPISIKDMFIELGGDSLRAMLAVNQISKQFSVNLKISDIYNNNIEQLEQVIKNRKSSYEELKSYSPKMSYPLTEIQKQLWFLWKLNPGLNNYVLQVEVSCDRDFSVELLNESWRNAVNSFDTLRIKFKENDGLPYFTIQDDCFFNIKEINLDQSNYIDEDDYRQSILSKGINLIEDELFQLVILKKGNSRKILLTTHEIVMDAWSLSVLLKYITNYYCFLLGKSEKPDNFKIGFKDFALWESYNRKPEQLIAEESFWKQQLSGEIETIKIPCDSANLLQNTHSNDFVNIKLPIEYVKKINSLSKDNNLTTYSIILSAFYILLNQFSNADDLIIGSPHVVRDIPGTENLIGFFLNMIPMRFNLKNKKKSFISICEEVNDIASQAMSNSAYPFSSMVNLLEIERSGISHPIFQIMFNMYSEKSENLNDIINFYAREKDNGFAKYDLVLYCQESEGTIYLQFSYSKDIFDKHLINRLAKQLQHIIKTCIFNEEIFLDRLPLVSDSEKSIVIGKADDYDMKYDNYNIYDAFLSICKEHNNKIAYFSTKKQYSYGELLDLVEKYSFFMSQYIKPNSCIAFDIDRGIVSIALILAAVKLNIPYVSINSNYPFNKIDEILSSLKPCLFISLHADRLNIIDPNAESIVLESNIYFYKMSVINKLDLENVFQLVYTSGSTGIPKAVKILNTSVKNRLFWMWTEFPFSNDEVCILQKSTSLVASTWEVLGGLLKAIPTVICEDNEVRDPYILFDLLDKYKVTRLLSSPAVLKGLIHVGNEIHKPNLLPHLQLVTSSAEILNTQVAKDFMNIYSHTKLYNFYGSSECSSNAAVHKVSEVDFNNAYIPIGNAISNVQLYILNENNQIVPKGVVGELAVSGDCLSAGYLSTENIIFHHTIPASEKPVYKTGDLVKINNDGKLVLLGRNDSLVKIDGFRIELDEIQHKLLQIEGVKDSATIVIKDDGENKIVSFVVLNEHYNSNLNEDEIKQKLKVSLPLYSVPRSINIIENIPKLPSGKIDKNSFPKVKFQTRTNTIQPNTTIQSLIANVWRDILKVEQISLLDSFFSLGGTSILSLKCISELGKLNIKITVSDLYNTSNLKELADKISYKKENNEQDAQNEKAISDHIMSPTVSYLLNTQQVGERYTVCRLWHDPESLINETILTKAIRRIADDYPLLKTKAKYDQKITLCQSALVPNLETVDLGDFNDEKNANKALCSYCDKAQGDFRFDDTSLLSRFILLNLNILNKKYKYLLIVMHHTLIDCFSFEMLISEIDRYYKNILVGTESFPAYEGEKHVTNWINLLKTNLQKNIFNYYNYWSQSFNFMKKFTSPLDKKDIVSWSSFNVFESINDVRLSPASESDYSIISKPNLFVIKLNKQYSDKLITLNNANVDTTDLILYSIFQAFSDDGFIYVDNLDMTRFISIDGVDLASSLGFIVEMFPMFIKLDKSLSDLEKLKCISDIKKDKLNSLFVRSLPHLLEMNLPNDFEIIYPNIIMNNHISLGSSTNDFLNLENTKLWLGSSSNPDNVHGVRVNIEPFNSNVYIDILYQHDLCNANRVHIFSESLIRVLNMLA